MEKPLILVTNDDGYNAPGIRHLIDFVKEMGDILVVAPENPQSGMGHAVTISYPLRLRKIVETENYSEYACNGTPVDAVKLALDKVCKRRPAILLSGINHGSNASINVVYSGTMGAAIEGALSGVVSIGFSLDDFSKDADFLAAKKFVQQIVKNVIEEDLEKNTCLNVNIPAIAEKDIKGIRVCRQAIANWVEEYEERSDPHGRQYFWLTGKFELLDSGQDTDIYALKNNYISVVPVTLDFTNHKQLDVLRNLDTDV